MTLLQIVKVEARKFNEDTPYTQKNEQDWNQNKLNIHLPFRLLASELSTDTQLHECTIMQTLPSSLWQCLLSSEVNNGMYNSSP